jgi:integrase
MPDAIPWPTFAAEVLELYEPPLRRLATQRKVRQVLDGLGRHCEHAGDLGPRAVARWLRDHPRWRPATMRTMLSSLRAVCNYGAAMGYLASPFRFRALRDWLPAEEPEPIVRHRSAVEIGKVLVRADSEALGGSWEARRDRALIYSLAFTGARAREILGLHRGDVDLVGQLVHIRPNPRRPLKTRRSRRALPIAGPLLPVLAGWMGREDRPSEWVFPHGELTGPWLHGTEESRALGRVRALGERAGVPGLTLLAFRHSFATAAEGWGLGELAVQRLLGHGRPQTQETYRHADPEQLRPAVDRIRF